METPPPSYSQYPRGPQQFGIGMPTRTPGIYFDYISVAFNMIWKNAGVYVVATLLIMVIGQAINFPLSFLNNYILFGRIDGRFDPNHLDTGMMLARFPLLIASVMIPTSILQVMYVGITLCAIEEADTGRTSINTMFSGFRHTLPVIGTSLLYFLLIYVGFILCFVPGVFVIGALGLAPTIAAKEGLGPIQSLQKSYQIMKSNAWAFAGLLFVAGLTNILGVLACCIGVLVTIPIQYVVTALTYRDFRENNSQPMYPV